MLPQQGQDDVSGFESLDPALAARTMARVSTKGKSTPDEPRTVHALGFSEQLFTERINRGYVIEEKSTGQLLPWGPLLKTNPPQYKVLKTAVQALRKGGPVRIIVLKGRKAGVSTALELMLLELAQQLPRWKVGVVAHTEDATGKLFNIARTAYEHCPAGLKRPYRYFQQGWIEFGEREVKERNDGNLGHEASFLTRTAGASYPFSGDTLRALHLSECAKYDSVGDMDDQMRFIMSALQAIPKNGASIVFAESSPNGRQGWFYDTWNGAVAGKNGWIPIFIGFLDDPSTQDIPIPEHYDWNNWEHEDKQREEALIEMGATKKHLYFRRFTIANELNGDPDLFDQEYPVNPAVAFLASGRPVIRKSVIERQSRNVSHPSRQLTARIIDMETSFGFSFGGRDAARR